MPQPDPTKFYCRCSVCAEVFVARGIKMPMDAVLLVKKLAKVKCPECGTGPKGITWASKEQAMSIVVRDRNAATVS